MNLRRFSWLLLAAGVVIYFVESSKGEFLFPWEPSLPGAQSLGLGVGEYLIAASLGTFIYHGR